MNKVIILGNYYKCLGNKDDREFKPRFNIYKSEDPFKINKVNIALNIPRR